MALEFTSEREIILHVCLNAHLSSLVLVGIIPTLIKFISGGIFSLLITRNGCHRSRGQGYDTKLSTIKFDTILLHDKRVISTFRTVSSGHVEKSGWSGHYFNASLLYYNKLIRRNKTIAITMIERS